MKKILFIFFIFYLQGVRAEEVTRKEIFLSSKTLDNLTTYFDDGWKFKEGDDSLMSTPSYDDSQWPVTSTTLFPPGEDPPTFMGIGWFRLHFTADSSIVNNPMALAMTHYGASQIYLDGKQIKSFGKINGPDSSLYFDPQELPFIFIIPAAGKHVLAVRYANFNVRKNYSIDRTALPGFRLSFGNANDMVSERDTKTTELSFILMLLSGIFLALSLLHLFMFLYYRKERSNFSFSMLMFCLATECIIGFIVYVTNNPSLELRSIYLVELIFCIACLSLSGFIHELFAKRKGIRYYVLIAFVALIMIPRFMGISIPFLFLSLLVYVLLEAIIMIIVAMVNRVKGARIIGVGVLFFAIFILTIFVLAVIHHGDNFELDGSTVEGIIFLVCLSLAVLSIPLSMSLYQAWSFASVNKDLALRLDEVSMLSKKTIEHEKEKQRMLEGRREELEKEVRQRTSELRESQEQLIQQEKLASLGQLTAGIAHEIKNPLNFVTNFSELSNELIAEFSSAQTEEERNEILSLLKENLDKINYHGKRADSIVKNMLEHSRGNTGEKQLTDINQLSDEFFNLAYHGMRATHPNFNCEMKKDFAAGLPKINMVSQDVSRVLLNLFNNAFYAVLKRDERRLSGEEKDYQPVVSISTLLLNNFVIIKIRDNGTGIPPEIKDKIFNPFFTTKPTGQGTGLGLSISYDIITKGHRGELSVDSKKGEFTEFVITLPAS